MSTAVFIDRYRHDVNDPTSLSNDIVYSIHVDRSGVVWAGTYGGGLNRFDAASGSFVQYHEPDGLASEKILSILEDGAPADPQPGNLWLGTGNGLSWLDRDRVTF